MYIKRLYIGDFGIFRNQGMEDISSGLVVVGGPNRAGKSTLMTVLNRLGYGITKSSIYPPANNKYYIEADIIKDDEENKYNIRLDGYSEPSVTILSAENYNDVSIQDLYHVDEFTYRQLFTIALDQLTKIPPDVGSREVVRLQSILLGAGLRDIMQVDALENQFRKKAESIGGKRGDITRKNFKPYVDIIKGGIDKKLKAIKHVDEYKSGLDELQSLEIQLKELSDRIMIQKSKLDLAEILLNNNQLYLDRLTLLSELEKHEGSDLPVDFPAHLLDKVNAYYEDYKSASEEYEKQYCIVEEKLDTRTREKTIKLLIDNAGPMDIYHEGISGLKEKVKGVSSKKEQLRHDKNDIIDDIKAINARWGAEDFDFIENLKLDLIEEARLQDAVTEIKNSEDRIKLYELRLNEDEAAAGFLKDNSTAEDTVELLPNIMKRYMVFYIISLLTGVLLYFAVNPLAGIAAFVFGVGGSILYYIFTAFNRRGHMLNKKEQLTKLKELEQNIAKHRRIIENNKKNQEKWLETLYKAADTMGLGRENVSVPESDRIINRFRELKNIQSKIRRYNYDAADCLQAEEEINDEINRIDALLLSFEDENNITGSGLYLNDRFNNVLNRFAVWYDILKLVKTLENLRTRKTERENRLLSLIEDHCVSGDIEDRYNCFVKKAELFLSYNKLKDRLKEIDDTISRLVSTEKVNKIAACLKQDEVPKDISFEFLYDLIGISPFDDMKVVHEKILNDLEHLEGDVENLKDRRQRLMADLEKLSETTDIELAQEAIDSGKKAFFPIAYSYAVNSAAAYICGNIRRLLMERMKGEMISNAGEILKSITGGEYESIEPVDDFASADFTFTLNDGRVQDSIDILSRGTREQVFLAVRLGRILDIKPPLPVIIDDTFVNFDRSHLYNLMQVIKRLTNTHQVFIMTCHPHMVNMIADAGIEAQYWHLDNGILTISDKDDLEKSLNRKSIINFCQ